MGCVNFRSSSITTGVSKHSVGSLVTTAWRVLRLRIEDTAARYEYTEYAVANSRQGVTLQRGGLAEWYENLTVNGRQVTEG
jgi:hypothetical protein